MPDRCFGAKFKQRLTEANFGVIRFLTGNSATQPMSRRGRPRKPMSYVFYSGSEFRASLYAGLTTNVGAAYSAQLPGFKLADKATVIVKFNASNNGACTLNVNGTGAINILSEYSSTTFRGSNSYPVGGTGKASRHLFMTQP